VPTLLAVLPLSKKEAAAAKAAHEAAVRAGPTGGLVPCPPCAAPVTRPCVGGHETREVPCSSPRAFACSGECARPLACTRHACALPCHGVVSVVGEEATGAGAAGDDAAAGLWGACEECALPCELPRPSGCDHPCASGGCHEGNCEPCSERRRERCHCGSRDVTRGCSQFSEAPEGSAARAAKLLNCGNICSVKFSDCPHACAAACHPGPCPDPSPPSTDPQEKKGCAKRVAVRCPCNRRSKRVACWTVRVAAAAAAAAAAATKPGSSEATKAAFAAWAAGDAKPPPVLECTSECSSKTAAAAEAVAAGAGPGAVAGARAAGAGVGAGAEAAAAAAADVKPEKGEEAEGADLDPVERRRRQKERKKEDQERRRVAAAQAGRVVCSFE
jgi:hypothetical protein